MVYVDVLPNESRLIYARDCVLITATSTKGVCDICCYSGDKSLKQVKEAYGVVACKACFKSMEDMKEEINEICT